MTVHELYKKLTQRLPDSLSESWDNDGLMVCADTEAPVRRVLLTLDVTENAVDFAIEKSLRSHSFASPFDLPPPPGGDRG